MNIHKEEVNNELIRTKNVLREKLIRSNASVTVCIICWNI